MPSNQGLESIEVVHILVASPETLWFEFLSVMIGHPVTHAQTMQAIYNVFFASLLIMLVLSSAIILYSGLYRSAEAEYLLTTPVRPERIVLHKFQEAIVFSSWGFLLLGSPMLVAYGLQAGAPNEVRMALQGEWPKNVVNKAVKDNNRAGI